MLEENKKILVIAASIVIIAAFGLAFIFRRSDSE